MTGEFKKVKKERNYIKSSEALSVEKSYAEHDHDFKMESSHAPEDHSAQSDVELTDAELLRRFRTSNSSNIIPNAPNMDGFHLCWVPMQSNNHYDTVEFRKTIGYAVVKQDEMPKMMNVSNRSGEVEGCISHNELVLMKIPNRLYQLYMTESHHTQPFEQEQVIKQTITQMEDKEGASLVRDANEMTGINNLARKVRNPIFN